MTSVESSAFLVTGNAGRLAPELQSAAVRQVAIQYLSQVGEVDCAATSFANLLALEGAGEMVVKGAEQFALIKLGISATKAANPSALERVYNQFFEILATGKGAPPGATDMGLEAVGFGDMAADVPASFSEVAEEAQGTPFLAQLVADDANPDKIHLHTVLVEAIDGDTALIVDPIYGPRTVSTTFLSRNFGGKITAFLPR